jgi:hypothetical protein
MKSGVLEAISSVNAGGSKTRLNSQATQSKSENSKESLELLALLSQAEQSENQHIIGNHRIETKIDWLQFAGDMPAEQLYPFITEVEKLTKEIIHQRPGKPSWGANGEYQNSGRSLKGVRLAWDNRDKDGKCRCLISIPGKVLSAMKILTVRELAIGILLTGLHCTRLDIAIDDFAKRLSFQTIVGALLAGNYAKFKSWDWRFSKGGGICIYFGSRESARSTKIYDKFVESKGKVNAYRLETKFGNKLANNVLLEWLMIDPDTLTDGWERESASYLMKSVVGSVNFIDRGVKPDEKNLSRLPRLYWWEAFVELVGGEIYHTAPVVQTSLDRAVQYHKRSTLRSLVCIIKALNMINAEDAKAWVLNQFKMAEATLTAVHHHRIEQYAEEYWRWKSWDKAKALDMAA